MLPPAARRRAARADRARCEPTRRTPTRPCSSTCESGGGRRTCWRRSRCRPDVFPEVVAPWQVAGAVSAEVAAATGAPPGCPVVIGAADSQCAAYGSGVNRSGPDQRDGRRLVMSELDRPRAARRPGRHPLQPRPAGPLLHRAWRQHDRRGGQWAVGRLAFADYATLRVGAVPRIGSGAPPRRRRRGNGRRGGAAVPALPRRRRAQRRRAPRGFIGLADRHGRDALAYAVAGGRGPRRPVGDGACSSRPGPRSTELRVGGGGARMDLVGQLKADLLGLPVLHLGLDPAGSARRCSARPRPGTAADAAAAGSRSGSQARRSSPRARAQRSSGTVPRGSTRCERAPPCITRRS